MVDSRQKGARAETAVRDILRKETGLGWERVPGSGALDAKHNLKGDLYVPNANNIYCVEVKHYADDHLTSKLLTSKTPQIIEWWKQTVRESNQVNKVPLLIYKFDRSKCFVAFTQTPVEGYDYLSVNVLGHRFHTCELLEWLKYETPKFV